MSDNEALVAETTPILKRPPRSLLSKAAVTALNAMAPEESHFTSQHGHVAHHAINKQRGQKNLLRENYSHVTRKNLSLNLLNDIYFHVLFMSWWLLIPLMLVFYALVGLLCTALMYTDLGGFADPPDNFSDVYFMALFVLTNQGVGKHDPVSPWTRILTTVMSVGGVIFGAIITGLVYARFSQATARVSWADTAIIGMVSGRKALMIRSANERKSFFIKANVTLTYSRFEWIGRGPKRQQIRRFYDLDLERPHASVFALSWTHIHYISEDSPLYHTTPTSLHSEHAEFHVVLSGYDTSMVEKVFSWHSFTAEEIQWNMKYADMFIHVLGKQKVEMDFKRLSQTEQDDRDDTVLIASV